MPPNFVLQMLMVAFGLSSTVRCTIFEHILLILHIEAEVARAIASAGTATTSLHVEPDLSRRLEIDACAGNSLAAMALHEMTSLSWYLMLLGG